LINFLWAIDWVGILNLAGYLDIWGVMRKVSEYRPMAGVMRKVSGYGDGGGVVRSVWIRTCFGVLYGKFLDNCLLAALSDQAA
jgi:hypothetical protein